jgi:hypothetical protein
MTEKIKLHVKTNETLLKNAEKYIKEKIKSIIFEEGEFQNLESFATSLENYYVFELIRLAALQVLKGSLPPNAEKKILKKEEKRKGILYNRFETFLIETEEYFNIFSYLLDVVLEEAKRIYLFVEVQKEEIEKKISDIKKFVLDKI